MTLLAEADLDVRGRSALPAETVLEVLVGRLSRLGAGPGDDVAAAGHRRRRVAPQVLRLRLRRSAALRPAHEAGLAVGRLVLVDHALGGGLVDAPHGAARIASAASSAPASTAVTAVLVRVRISERTALLRSRRRSFWRLRLIWLRMLAT